MAALSPQETEATKGGKPSAPSPRSTDGAPIYDLIEALFFAYRDFVGDPDRMLSAYGFGRAHHRVLHFVNRNPGLTIAELLSILQITKQSLNRVLKELLEKQFIESKAGPTDRRQRLLFVTDAGRTLAEAMANRQTERILRALEEVGEEHKQTIMTFLSAMIDEEDRKRVDKLTADTQTDTARPTETDGTNGEKDQRTT